MKRDMDLIRALLIAVEGATEPDLSKWSEEEQLYHSVLLIESKLVHGFTAEGGDGSPVAAKMLRLTWEGHEFLDAARDETVWKKVRDKLEAVGTNVALPVLTSLLTDYTKQKLGIQ